MAETTGHQSSHISSSSAGDKGGSCAEIHAQYPSPESPGSPFEMIANSPGFEFKDSDGDNKVATHGLSHTSHERNHFDQPTETVPPFYVGYKQTGISVNEEELFINLDPMSHFRRATAEDFYSMQDSEPKSSHIGDSDKRITSDQAITDPVTLLPSSQGFCKGKLVEECIVKKDVGPQAICAEAGDSALKRKEESSYDAKSEIRWADADEEVDSSGESDDTVIDAGWRLKSIAAERLQHTEDGWVDVRELHQEDELECERSERGELSKLENVSSASSVWPNEYSTTESTLSADNTKNDSFRAALKTSDSSHSDGFVDLGESVTQPFRLATRGPETQSLEDKMQENLTIEALRTLADLGQEWDSESRESSPEILYLVTQPGSSEALMATGWLGQDEFIPNTESSLETSNFKVRDLLFWRDVKKSGMVFGVTMVLLLSLAAFSIISVISYLLLSLLTVTIGYRVYKSVMQAVQKSEEGHPFKSLLEKDITLSSDAFQKKVSSSLTHVNCALKYIIRLFLVEDLVDSLKLALLMWLMTYVGAVFNGITLLILGVLVAFTAPVVYEKYKVQIDHYVSLVHNQVKSITEKIQAKLPGALKKKAD